MNSHCLFVRAKAVALLFSVGALLCLQHQSRAQSFMLENYEILLSNLDNEQSESETIDYARWLATSFTTPVAEFDGQVHRLQSIVLDVILDKGFEESVYGRRIEIWTGNSLSGGTRLNLFDNLGSFRIGAGDGRDEEASNSRLLRFFAQPVFSLQPDRTYFLVFKEINPFLTSDRAQKSFTLSETAGTNFEGTWTMGNSIWGSTDQGGQWRRFELDRYLRFALIPEPAVLPVALILCALIFVLRSRNRRSRSSSSL